MTMEKEEHPIELRSEKIRNLIGEMPPFLIRWGNVIIFIAFCLLLVFAWIFGGNI